MFTAHQLREMISYDPVTGVFKWLYNSRNTRIGQEAGYRDRYVQIGISGRVYTAHRLAWLYMTGEWPTADLDHINGDKHDNRWDNLREADRSENNQNLGMRSDNKSGFKGVWWNQANRNWSAQIQHRGKRHCLGNYPTPEEAYAAYLAAKRKLHTFQPVPRYEEAA